MNILQTSIIFIYGIICGSFFNVVGRRLPKKESFATSRSKCPTCSTPIKNRDLIPVFSYILLRGKCRNCHQRISPLYPTIELLTGVLFAYSYIMFGWSIEFAGAILLVSLSVIILVSDLLYMIIPDRLLLFFLPLFIILRVLAPLDPWYASLIGAIGAYLLIALIILISKGGMGGGDMKLLALLGILFGYKIIMVFFLSTLIGALVTIALLATKTVNRKQPVPFGPFIIMAALLTYFHGDALLEWYSGLFFY
ncbi:prepilin peptidase [Thalassobacillus hwangdonensis]|uniref:Prepilin peptidase n=1 Tax=Thalassobacillus hwangdonensis TaxID=546108 RepID=A0ABW3KYF4_9BACI